MKKLNLFLVLFALAASAIFTSCEKEDETPPVGPVITCNIVCQNGGTVNTNCGCDCPTGFTGTNCQTQLQTPPFVTPIPISPNTYHQIKPAWYYGDNEFGGHLSIDWSVQLFMTNNNTKIYAKVYAYFKEYSSTGNTAAYIDPNLSGSQFLLYTAPSGKKVSTINCDYYLGNKLYPVIDFHGTTSFVNNTSNSFFNKIEFIGDTQGSDLPSDGSTANSRCRVYFKSFSVSLVNK